jgi:hypothetical protein
LPQNVRIAIKEIEYCYDLLKQHAIEKWFYDNGTLREGVDVDKAFNFFATDEYYGLSSPTELIAEITRPEILELIKEFDQKHKGENIFDKLISAILSLFGVNKEYTSLESTLKKAMMTLIDNPSKTTS